MVFGGCCSNVWTYERLLKLSPQIGSALTFSQMLFITLQGLPRFLTWQSSQSFLPTLRPRQVPMREWATQVVVLTAGSLLNNWVYAFDVPIPIQIVFRSAVPIVSMIFGYVFLRRSYSFTQVAAVVIVVVGVVLATLSRSSSQSSTSVDTGRYAVGILMLVSSLFLSGFLGILQERTYGKYGPCWREGVFYTHFLSLPAVLLFLPHVKKGFLDLHKASPSLQTSILILAANLGTQLVCVSGVNQLTSRVSSVSTNLVLTARKAMSLCLSVWWFGNGWNVQLASGASLVLTGSLLYAFAGLRQSDKKRE
ncbi:UAA transporter [Gloeophyllum trabeum ATCC 11539]|uniref:UAA transporter n=1 Tax=Gloeophyllum trabeum (strain ATCC 11539 / FP-39264 / Madison 617) TaxID=670483 RepID=S7Q8X1_GLOTA|nr:UAA transporter [Gloeophyllum trabeum ATCC 11539]EPQ56431.1 UAA transporter [Gloeophyllum trabeum ATCC 11539]